MKVIELKLLKTFFQDVKDGIKPFEIRFNDRDYQVTDILILKEYWNGEYTGREHTVTVTYVLDGGQYGIEQGYVVLGVKNNG